MRVVVNRFALSNLSECVESVDRETNALQTGDLDWHFEFMNKDTKERLRNKRSQIAEALDEYSAMLRGARIEANVEHQVSTLRKLQTHHEDVNEFAVKLRAVDHKRAKVHTDEAA